MTDVVANVDRVSKSFRRGWRRPAVAALTDVSLEIRRGEVLGLVGESGSGKSTLGRIIVGLLQPDRGHVYIEGRPVSSQKRSNRDIWRHVQLIFQDPYTSLNPAMTIGEILSEPLRYWHGRSPDKAAAEAETFLDQVGLQRDLIHSRPSSLSGGQRQRVSIARALAVRPSLIVCDEPTSALDVSVQAQILALIERLRSEYGTSYLFVSHDISVVRLVSDRTVVMQSGEVVESVPTSALTVEGVGNAYTKDLLSAVPVLKTS